MSRESFEAWVKLDSTLSVERDGDGYADMDVYLMWRVWPVAQADAFERAAKVCDGISKERDDESTNWQRPSRCEFLCGESSGAEDCAEAIRALSKEAGNA